MMHMNENIPPLQAEDGYVCITNCGSPALSFAPIATEPSSIFLSTPFSSLKNGTLHPPVSEPMKVKGLDFFLESPNLTSAFASIFAHSSSFLKTSGRSSASSKTEVTPAIVFGRTLNSGSYQSNENCFPNLQNFLVSFLYSPPSEPLPSDPLSDLEVEFLRLLLKHRLTLPRKKEAKLHKIDTELFNQSSYYSICADLRLELRPAENPILKRTLANQIQKLKRKRGIDAPEPLSWAATQEKLIADSRKTFLQRYEKLTQALQHAVENPDNHSLFNNFHLPLIRVQISKAPDLLKNLL